MKRLLWIGPHIPSELPGFTIVGTGRSDVVVVDVAAGESHKNYTNLGSPVVLLGNKRHVLSPPVDVCYVILKPVPPAVLADVLSRVFQDDKPSFLATVEAAMEEKGLTSREKEACKMALRGFSDRQMSEAQTGWGPAEKTWKIHLGSVFRKFGVGKRAELFAAIFPF